LLPDDARILDLFKGNNGAEKEHGSEPAILQNRYYSFDLPFLSRLVV
jgi:hypothetical protein